MARPKHTRPPSFEPFEDQLRAQGVFAIAGVDEVGRGCLAGAVVAAAVILPPAFYLPDLNDSKRLTPRIREALSALIHEQAVAVGIGEGSVAEIGDLNILQASLLAMRRAIEALVPAADHLLVDGNQRIAMALPQLTLVKGDSRSASIAAASIVAKVYRDEQLIAFAEQYPGYGFEDHKGYGTEQHRTAIARLGPCPIHRLTFSGVAEHVLPPVRQEQAPRPAGIPDDTPTIIEARCFEQLGLFGPGQSR